MRMDIKTNFPEVKGWIERLGKQGRYAAAVALTKTAQDVKAALRSGMVSSFDRPTPYTLGALFLSRATKTDLQAVVWLKGQGLADTNSSTHYLRPQIEGGSRPMKVFEQRLVRTGFMAPNERAVPGSGAKLNRYGNVSPGQIVKILSQLKTAYLAGDYSNATNSRRSRANRKREGYFAAGGRRSLQIEGGNRSVMKTGGAGKTSHLPRGIWVRRNKGAAGSSIQPVFLFVQKANYRRRYDFFGIAQRTFDAKFSGHFAVAIQTAIRTAR